MSDPFKAITKKFILVLKLYKLYLFDPSIVFQFNFSTQVYFSYFLFLVQERERKRKPYSGGRERKLTLIPILDTKMVDLGVKIFCLVRGFQLRCFFTLN
jgi:hypothetical protein